MSSVANRPSSGSLLVAWTRARLLATLRTPRATFFTFVFPLLFLVIFNATNSSTVPIGGGKVNFAQFFTPSVGIFALTTSCYTSTIFAMAASRELGVLKRIRGMPLPPWIYLTSFLAGTIVIGIMAVVLMFIVGVPAFGVKIYPELLPAAAVTLVLSGISLGAIGLAVSTFVNKAEAAPAIANLTLFPLLFLSGIFYPITNAPSWVTTLANIFPIHHAAVAFGDCFSPFTTGSGFAWNHLAVIALWAVAGIAIAARRFKWEGEGSSAPGARALFGRGGG